MDSVSDAEHHHIISQAIDGDIEIDSLSESSINALSNPNRKRRLQMLSSHKKSPAPYNADHYANLQDVESVGEINDVSHRADDEDEDGVNDDTDDDQDDAGGEDSDAEVASEGDDDDAAAEDDELRSEDGEAEDVNDADDDTHGVDHDAENVEEDEEAVETDDDDNNDDAGDESDEAASANETDDNDNESTSYYSDSESGTSRTGSSQGSDDDEAEDSNDEDEKGSQKKTENPDDESSMSDDQEEFEDYKVKKCYYPVQMEDFYAKRYSVIRKIGWGHFSTVWLCYDVQTKRFVALKVVRAGKTYCETADDEIKLGLAVDEGAKRKSAGGQAQAESLRSNLIRVLDNFNLSGPFGKHVCITFDLLGQNLLDLIKRAQETREELGTARYGAIPLANVRSITEKILRGLKHLHENCQIIHTDLKPENVLLSVPERAIKEMVRYVSSLKKEQRPNYMMSSFEFRQYHQKASGDNASASQASVTNEVVDDRTHKHFLLDPDPSTSLVDNVQVKIADLGNACWTHKKFTDEIQTKEYRALESIVVADYSTPADIWSVACIAYECATGDYLFPCRHRRNRSSDEDHLLMIIERCARAIPKKFALAGKESKKFFHNNGKLICCPDVAQVLSQKNKTIKDLLISRYSWTNDQARLFSQFLLPMLEYDPERRATADAMLQHSWMSPAKTHIHEQNHVVDANVPNMSSMFPSAADQPAATASNFLFDHPQTTVMQSQQTEVVGFSSGFQFQPLSSATAAGGVTPLLNSSLLTAAYGKNELFPSTLQPPADAASSFANKFSSMPYDGSGGSSRMMDGSGSSNNYDMQDYRFSSGALSSSINNNNNNSNNNTNNTESGSVSFKYGRFDALSSNTANKRAALPTSPVQQQLFMQNDLMRDGGDFLAETSASINGAKFSSPVNDTMPTLVGASSIDEPVRKIDNLKLRSQS